MQKRGQIERTLHLCAFALFFCKKKQREKGNMVLLFVCLVFAFCLPYEIYLMLQFALTNVSAVLAAFLLVSMTLRCTWVISWMASCTIGRKNRSRRGLTSPDYADPTCMGFYLIIFLIHFWINWLWFYHCFSKRCVSSSFGTVKIWGRGETLRGWYWINMSFTPKRWLRRRTCGMALHGTALAIQNLGSCAVQTQSLVPTEPHHSWSQTCDPKTCQHHPTSSFRTNLSPLFNWEWSKNRLEFRKDKANKNRSLPAIRHGAFQVEHLARSQTSRWKRADFVER